MSSMPQLAGALATISQAIKDPSRTAGEFGEEMAETILSFPKGFLANWLEQVLILAVIF